MDDTLEDAVREHNPDAAVVVDATGLQLTSARFDLGLSDVFEMQDEAGRRIAEALRLEIVTRSAGGQVPDEVVQLYLRARTILRTQQF